MTAAKRKSVFMKKRATIALCLLSVAMLAQHPAASTAIPVQTDRKGFHQDLAWSPDGSKISYSWNGEGSFEIYVMQAAGSAARNLTHDAASDRYATWSPDGGKIAFASDRAGKD